MFSTIDLHLFETVPGSNVLLLPDAPNFTIVTVTDDHVQVTGRGMDEVKGKSLFAVFPGRDKESEQALQASFTHVLTNGEPHRLSTRYDIVGANGAFEERYWSTLTRPVRNDAGEIIYLIHSIEDVTYKVQLKKALEGVDAAKKMQESEARFRSLLKAAPIGIGVYKGRELVIEMANAAMIGLLGKGDGIIGMRFADALPELAHQPVMKMLDEAYAGGKMFEVTETPVDVAHEGTLRRGYYDFSYTPLFDADGNVYALLNIATEVTERVKARKVLEESELNLRNMILQAPVAICIFRGPAFVVEVVNPLMEGMLGRKAADLQGRAFFEAMPELRNQGLEPILEGIMREGRSFIAHEQPFQLPREATLETRYVTYIYEPVRETDGTLSGVMVVATDVTEQLLARKKVEVVNQELQFVTDTMPQLVWATEANGSAYFFNKGWLEYTGLSLEAVKGNGWMQSLHPDDLGRTKDAWKQAYKKSGAYEIEYRLKRHDGQYRWFLTRGTPMKDGQGHILKWYGSTTDVDEQKRAAEDLQQSTERFHLVAKATQDAIWDWNLRTNEIWWNEGFKELFRYAEEEIEPTIDSWYNRVHPDDKERVVGGIHEVIDNGGHNWSAEYRFRRKDGSYATVFDRGYALHDKNGMPYRMLGSMQDITERKQSQQELERRVEERTRALAQANEALQKSNAELERSNQNLEQFAYAASHDLKEPMRKIQIFTDRLKGRLEGKLEEADKHFFGRILYATQRMDTLIEDLLLYSHVSRGAVLEEKVNLNEKVQMVLEDLEVAIAEKDASVSLEPLPTIRGNKRQLQQLFQNLIGNAIKYGKPGVPPRVHISCRTVSGNDPAAAGRTNGEDRPYYLVQVKDNGIGFDPEDAERIFNVFTRLHGNAEYKGTGVGLSIAQKVVHNLGGYIWAESSAGQGATFNILFPMG